MPQCPVCREKRTRRYAQKGAYVYFLCTSCGTVFLAPFPSDQELKKYYTKLFTYNLETDVTARMRVRTQYIVKTLRELFPEGKTVLDVGSGVGLILREGEKNNLLVTGVEPSKNLARVSYQPLKGTLFTGTFEEFYTHHLPSGKKFDFIVLSHVIEHLNDPKRTLYRLSRLLKQKGVLYIETPNRNSWLFWAEKEQYTFLTPPDHLILFSQHTLLSLTPSSLHPIKIETYSFPEHFAGIFKTVLKGKKSTESKKSAYHVEARNPSIRKTIQSILVDTFISRLFYRLLNVGNKGSVLTVYMQRF